MRLPGSERNVQQLVDGHYEALYRYAYRLSGSAADAEDLAQEAFCKAQANYWQLREPDKARPWLFSILRNVYLLRLREKRHLPTVSLNGVADVPDQARTLPAVAPEQLQEALNSLPEPFRTPVILYYFEEFSYRDIAEQLDVPIGTVMSRLARAKAYLRERLLAVEPALAAAKGLED